MVCQREAIPTYPVITTENCGNMPLPWDHGNQIHLTRTQGFDHEDRASIIQYI